MAAPERSRIATFERGSLALVADRLTSIPEGWVVQTPSLPMVYSLNHVGVTRPIEAADAIELVERHMAQHPYRQLVVEDEPSGERLERELPGRGWKTDRHVLMALRREPDRDRETSRVIAVDERDALWLMDRWLGEDEELGNSPVMRRQVLEATRLTWRARNARHFGVLSLKGSLAGMTMLFSDGAVGQVEDVYLIPGERGRGLGRALVTHAVVQSLDAGHEVTFIAGDDNDWPKELYASVGFEAVARVWWFHRRVPE